MRLSPAIQRSAESGRHLAKGFNRLPLAELFLEALAVWQLTDIRTRPIRGWHPSPRSGQRGRATGLIVFPVSMSSPAKLNGLALSSGGFGPANGSPGCPLAAHRRRHATRWVMCGLFVG